jgi:hypothetical protein
MANARLEHRRNLAARDEQSGNGRSVTRYWQSGRQEQEARAPARGRRAPWAHRPGCRPAGKFSLPRQRRHRAYASLRHLDPAETTTAPDCPAPLSSSVRARLFGEVLIEVNLVFWSRRRSQRRDHGATLRSGTCGAVNSMAQATPHPAVLEHSKFGIKGFVTMQCLFRMGLLQGAGRAPAASDSRLLKRRGLPLKYLIR